MKKIFIILFALCAAATSCTNKSEKEIEEEIAPGVVLVQNNSYYEVVLSNGESLFFTGFDKDGDIQGIAFNEDSVKRHHTERDSSSQRQERWRQMHTSSPTWWQTKR